MDNFNLKKYLAESKLLKEEVMVNPIIMFGGKDYIKGIIAEPDDFGHFPEDAEWIKSNILTAPKMMSIQDYMVLDDKWVKQAQIEVGSGADLDHIVDALNTHVEKGLITPKQKDEAMEIIGLGEVEIDESKLVKEESNEMEAYIGNNIDANSLLSILAEYLPYSHIHQDKKLDLDDALEMVNQFVEFTGMDSNGDEFLEHIADTEEAFKSDKIN